MLVRIQLLCCSGLISQQYNRLISTVLSGRDATACQQEAQQETARDCRRHTVRHVGGSISSYTIFGSYPENEGTGGKNLFANTRCFRIASTDANRPRPGLWTRNGKEKRSRRGAIGRTERANAGDLAGLKFNYGGKQRSRR